MKKIGICILFALMAVSITSCRYEEGPFFSLRKAEDRLVGYWKLADVYLNDEHIDSTAVIPNRPGNYYAFFTERMVSVTALDNNTWVESIYGSWEFQNKNKDLFVSYKMKNKSYEYVAEIKRLTRDELIYEYYDNKGDKWRFEFDSRSSMYY